MAFEFPVIVMNPVFEFRMLPCISEVPNDNPIDPWFVRLANRKVASLPEMNPVSARFVRSLVNSIWLCIASMNPALVLFALLNLRCWFVVVLTCPFTVLLSEALICPKPCNTALLFSVVAVSVPPPISRSAFSSMFMLFVILKCLPVDTSSVCPTSDDWPMLKSSCVIFSVPEKKSRNSNPESESVESVPPPMVMTVPSVVCPSMRNVFPMVIVPTESLAACIGERNVDCVMCSFPTMKFSVLFSSSISLTFSVPPKMLTGLFPQTFSLFATLTVVLVLMTSWASPPAVVSDPPMYRLFVLFHVVSCPLSVTVASAVENLPI